MIYMEHHWEPGGALVVWGRQRQLFRKCEQKFRVSKIIDRFFVYISLPLVLMSQINSGFAKIFCSRTAAAIFS